MTGIGRTAVLLLFPSALAVCDALDADETHSMGGTTNRLLPAQKQPIIVTLAIRGESIAIIAAQIMERLKPDMPAEDFAAVRTFNLFPAIALSANAKLIERLLAMPEVLAIERDIELKFNTPVPAQ